MIEIHRYQLILRGAYSKSALRGPAARGGSLVRMKFSDGVIGHADLFPWPELGDATLPDLLTELAEADRKSEGDFSSTRIILQAKAATDHRFLLLPRLLDAAEAEAESLRRVRPLVDGSIQNHFTALSASRLVPADILDARRGGFPAIKIKIARGANSSENLLAEAKALGRLQSHWDLPLRLDANENGTPEAIRVFLDALPIRLRDSIEFIEDPFPFSIKTWSDFHKETAVKLAIDRPVMSLVHSRANGTRTEGNSGVPSESLTDVFRENAAQAYIHKPSWLSDDVATLAIKAGVPVIVTSALGHPVGNLWAASVAARLVPTGVHGCFTHPVYRDDEISNSLIASKQIRGSRIFGLGAGLGLPAKSLTRIKWELLA